VEQAAGLLAEVAGPGHFCRFSGSLPERSSRLIWVLLSGRLRCAQ